MSDVSPPQDGFEDSTFPTELVSMFMAVASDSVALNGSQATHLQVGSTPTSFFLR